MGSRKYTLLLAGAASAVFIGINALITANGSLIFNLVPVLLLMGILALVKLDAVYYLILFCTPLSIQLSTLFPSITADLSIPTEPLMGGVLVLLVFRELAGKGFDIRVLLHPVSLTILASLAWMFITSVTSSIPLVSFKYLLARIWFLATFYFLAVHVLTTPKKIIQSWWFYIIPFVLVIIYTLTQHIGYHLTQMTAHFVMKPFYKDHTSYGALLAMYIPVLFSLAVLYFRGGTLLKNTITWLFIALFLFALVFSYTRAAWISILGATGVFILLFFRVRLQVILLGFLALVMLFFAFRTTIIMRMEENKQDSSSNFTQHIQSISNIATDASNLERINRWNSALRMFRERPVFGFGPGTYQFNYAPFQLSGEKTIISTNFGTRGNAHSEYLGPLSEQGVLGMLSFLVIIGTVVYTAIKVYLRSKDRVVKILCMASLMGLITYYLHGILNNFLDTDKASAPFWGFTAIIVALDIYHSREEKTVEE
ncbi:MAG: O-antigen ligase family protein [Bacteroidales bacterium]